MKENNSKIPLENKTKNLQVSKLFHKKRKENLKRIISQEESEPRMNRSIQVEGAFAQVKQNMKFRRFLSRGKENTLSECIIVVIAHNISRLHNKIVKNKYGIYLHPLKKYYKFIVYN
ncbi:TPA: transposase [Clostridioides difficile]